MDKPKQEYDITGSVVAYKTTPEDLERIVRSFCCPNLSTSLMVVDNSPTNELDAVCRGLKVKYYHTGENIGFGAAHNLAMQELIGCSRYHVVLNPDIYFDGSILATLFDLCEAHPSIGHVMPKILYPDGTLQRLYKKLPTPFDIASRRLFPPVLKRVFRKWMYEFELRHLDPDQAISVPFLSGCFMFFRTSALAEVGVFDERFFMYFEDADLTRRIREHYDTVYFPDVTVAHEHGRGSYRSIRLFFHSCCSAVKYFRKWGWFIDTRRCAANRSIRAVTYGSYATHHLNNSESSSGS